MAKTETVDAHGREDGGAPRQYAGAWVPVRITIMQRVEASNECASDDDYRRCAERLLEAEFGKRWLEYEVEIDGFGAVQRDQVPGSEDKHG